MPDQPPIGSRTLRLCGAQVLTPAGFADATLTIAGGAVANLGADLRADLGAEAGAADGPGAAIDLSGFWLLPGIVDLHGDAFERHMTPRSGVGFDFALGFASVDADLCAHGVTTAYLAQCFGWEGGKRGADYAEALILARASYASRSDIRLQLRYETHFIDGADRLLAAARSGAVRYVVFNNHLDEAEATWARNPAIVSAWASEMGRSGEEHMAIVAAAQARGPEVPASLARIADELRAAGAIFGSHDDGEPEARARFDALGAHVCEFPTSRAAAAEAKARGNPVLMGAPNVVRGGSQSGNVAAEALIAEGLCDVLVSDYYYPALAAAAWALADRGQRFADAWGMISAAPASVLGLADRGALREGARADVVVMDPATRRIEATFVAGRLAHLTGAAAGRFVAGLAGG